MSTTSSSGETIEITDDNFETFLSDDEGFVEFFNAFLALPCFAERLFYNSELEVFEEFTEKLADDVGKGDVKSASQLRQFTHFKGTIYNVADNQSRIGYYVTVLDKVHGLEFVKKHRLPLFMRSELYAEFKLSKHLSAVQESFFRGLYSESSDEDSGVEELTVVRPLTRRRSVVSFNLSPSLGGDEQSSEEENERESEEHLYLPTHVRTIEETFDAWHESFTRSDSRISMFSSGAGSPYPRTPQILEEEEEEGEVTPKFMNEEDALETQSSYSMSSVQESEVSVGNNFRPASRMSFLSDDFEKTLNANERSTASSASSVSLAMETASQNSVVQEELNVGNENNEKSFGADEMTRSLSSVVSFITEHGQVSRSSSTLENVDGETVSYQVSSKEGAEHNASSPPNESNLDVVLSTYEQNVNAPGAVLEGGENTRMSESVVVAMGKDDVSIVESEQNASTLNIEVGEDNFSPVGDDNDEVTTQTSDGGKIPSIVETMCSDYEDGELTITGTSVDTNSEIKSVDEENRESVREVASEELSQVNEDLEESSVNSVAEGKDKDEEKQEKEVFGDLSKEDCLHCRSISEGKDAVLMDGFRDSLNDVDDSAQSKPLDPSSETSTMLADHCTDQKDSENESLVYQDIPTELGGKSEAGAQESKLLVEEESEEKAANKPGSTDPPISSEHCESQESQSVTEPQDAPEGENDSLEESEGKNEGNDEDDEGGYTTEASATTLQGIRGVLGRRRLTRCSTAATSIGFDIDDESAFSDDGFDAEEKPYDLATKDGFEAFKQFLLDTSGEKMLQFWLEVECGRHLDDDGQKNRLVQNIRDRYWKSGGIYEFSAATKTRLKMLDASLLTYNSLFAVQPDVLEPLLSYWSIRFTMHQQRRSVSRDLEYTRLVKERPKSCMKRESALSNLPQVPAHTGLAQVHSDKLITRPQSSTVKKTTRHQTSKPQLRAKSAHPRLLQANKCIHTNASTKQLQYILEPWKTGYGFEQPPGPTFPVEPEPDYLPSVRLFINPIPSPDSNIQRMMRTLHRTTLLPPSSASAVVQKEIGCKPDVSLDSLIQGLIYERQTGNYFQMYLQTTGNKTWMNCLAFWKSLQEYNAYFFADALNPSLLSRKARTMYATFVVSGSAQDVHVIRDIQTQVLKELEPPFEELFDAVEEHVLQSLLEPWNMLIVQEKNQYKDEVPTEQRLRHIEIQVTARRRQSIVHTNGGLGNAEEDHEKERISVEEANRPLPVPKDGVTFESLIRNREEVEHFKEFLNKKHARGLKDLMAWTDMETFRRVPRFMEEKRDKKAREIRDNWLGKKYFFGPDSPATREGRNLIMDLNGGRPIKERPASPVILESQKFVRARIERRWLMLFKQTVEFLERQKPKVATVPEMVEDIMLKRRLQRSEAAWKILNSRWVSSSRDVVALRQTLLNPSSCSEFSAFVAVKGDTLESNIQFWLEVQKFKDLCHAHAQPALIQRKVQTIIDCFLNSAIAPELQIDIPIEMADKLMERLSGRNPSLHPYVFREAQMTVFRVLFNHWKEFVTQRSKIPEGVHPREHFKELLSRHRADTKSKKEASERRRLARLSAERKKKDKEEREKKRIEDLASLFSMETASIFYSEEDDLRSWFYSKHLVEQERQEHIKRLREQGIIIPEEGLVEEKEETKSRRSRVSIAKSSILGKKVHEGLSDKKSSEDSSRRLQAKLLKPNANGQLFTSLGRRGSVVSTSLSVTRRNSGVSLALSRKDEKVSAVTSVKEEKITEKCDDKDLSRKDTKDVKQAERKSPEIQVIPLLSPETTQQTSQERKLLPQRSRSSKRLLSSKQPPKSAGKTPVPLDAISCISDYSVLSNIEFAPRQRTTAGKNGHKEAGTSLLTSKSLKDFTNSPEGAQLSMPLPLVRITSASHLEKSDTDGSVGDPSPLYYKPRPLTQSLRKTPIRLGSRKGLRFAKEDMQIIPDVEVN